MKIVLSSRGSRGDVNPVIEVACELQNHGHRVKLCVPKYFESYAKDRGIDVSYTYSEDTTTLMKGFGSGWYSMKRALDWFSTSIEEQFEYLLNDARDADVIVTSAAEMAGPSISEHFNIPYVRMAYAPILPGDQPPPLSKWQDLPPWGNRIMWSLVNGATGLFIKRFLNKKRKYLEMRGMGKTGEYFAGNSHNMLAINSKLAPPSKLWERYNYKYTGYCYGSIFGELDKNLLDFINSGSKPVYVGFGSVSVKGPDKLTQIMIDAARRSGTRLVMGTGWAGLGNSKLPDYVYPVKATQHGSLFPKMAGIIHHGGSGTTHTCAKSGVPQFIMPQLVDQYYWGNSIYKLGLGPKPVTTGKISVNKMADILNDLRNNSSYAEKANALGLEMESENGVVEVARYINSLCSSESFVKDKTDQKQAHV